MDPFLFPLIALLFPAVGGVAVIYLGVRFVRAFERRGADRAELQALRDRLAQLEEEVVRANEGVERLEEEQRFTLRLLAERQGTLPPSA